MMSAGAAALIGQGVNAASSLGLGIGTNVLNWKIQKRAWEREDNAVQRRKEDLIAAGFNPVLATGQAASSMAPVRMQAPESNFDINKGLEAKVLANQYRKTLADAVASEWMSKDLAARYHWTWERGTLGETKDSDGFVMPSGGAAIGAQAQAALSTASLTGTNAAAALFEYGLAKSYGEAERIVNMVTRGIGGITKLPGIPK